MNLKEASEKAFEISKKRNQYKNDGQDILRALKHCAGEVIEATEASAKMEYFPQLNKNEQEIVKEDFENELADIIICVLSICGAENIDIEKAIERKMKINEERAELTK